MELSNWIFRFIDAVNILLIKNLRLFLYKGNDTHYFDFDRYEYSLNEITWKDFDQVLAFKYRMYNEYGTTSDNEGHKYVTAEDALKLFNDVVEYGKYQSLKNSQGVKI